MFPRVRLAVSLTFLSALLVSGCAAEMGEYEPDCADGRCDNLERSFCSIQLAGATSEIEIESDYLPNVLACENETGGLESLKALAISARSYAYYKLSRGETVEDGVGDQVYSCGRTPTALHRQAVDETSGITLSYRGKRVAAFFVAGAHQVSSTCRGGGTDPSRTERFVTYNQGLVAEELTQTRLGFRSPDFFANRGCLSQNGANCLADQGETAADIIHFYYGEDIEIEKATASCILLAAVIGPSSRQEGQWIGDDCSLDSSVCDIEEGGVTGACYTWFNGDPYSGGFCSLECEGECLGTVNGQTFCGQVEPSEGRCLLVPSQQNGYCSDLPNTVAQVIERNSAAGQPRDWRGACVPMGQELLGCEDSEGQQGECIDTDSMECGVETVGGLCPGGSSIRCCID
ncbi:MAG: hypothetical protein GY811_28650 [Myxococcales bacterium]|nr:hypothetical protein [Myxococcales bacterium]